ncbi:MAG: FliH/SctL family protein, partial [Thermodesulfobacteriota bacterium]|nr:FliH/SctL family protein [Thermodesulfobacteriota bacterium]
RDEKAEAEYLERVRERATLLAKDILIQALAEAEVLKKDAIEKGVAQGRKQAREQMDQELAKQSEALAKALGAIQEGGTALWEKHRQDIVTLTRLAVEKVLRIEISKAREEILAGLLDQALEVIDSQRDLVIRVHPDDANLLEDLLHRAKAEHPALEQWRVKADPGLARGGLILESDHGMVDNTLEKRRESIEPILDQLASST